MKKPMNKKPPQLEMDDEHEDAMPDKAPKKSGHGPIDLANQIASFMSKQQLKKKKDPKGDGSGDEAEALAANEESKQVRDKKFKKVK